MDNREDPSDKPVSHPAVHAMQTNGTRILLAAGLAGYMITVVLVARKWDLPTIGVWAGFLLTLAVVAEFGAKGTVGLLFRATLARQQHAVTVGASLEAAMVGTATARLLPAGGAMAPSAMGWAVRAEDDQAAGAALRATTIGYGGLLVLTGVTLGLAASFGSNPLMSTGTTLTGLALAIVGSMFLVGSQKLDRVVAILPGWLRRHFGPTARAGALTKVEIGLIVARIALEASVLWLVLGAFDIDLTPAQTIVAFGTATLIAGLPITPGGLGLVEGGLLGALGGFGFSAETVVAPILVYRIINYWLAAGVGLYVAGRIVRRSHADK